MRWILGLVGALLGGLAGEEVGLFLGLAVGLLIGWAIERERKRASYVSQRSSPPGSFEARATARLLELTERVARLEREVAALRAARAPTAGALLGAPEVAPAVAAEAPSEATEHVEVNAAGAPLAAERADSPSDEGPLRTEGAPMRADAAPSLLAPEAIAAAPGPAGVASETDVHTSGPQGAPSTAAAHDDTFDVRAQAAASAVREFLFGGNTVVRIGIVVLTVGLGLLAKYAAEHSYFPLELRLAFAALVGIALIVLGFRLHATRAGFGTALEGGGIGALYLVTFFAFSRYDLVPPALAFPLLVAIAALSSLLAVLQDAQQLAVFGALGGFLAPVLASRGGGSHVALFSYYALLNAAVVGVALFRSWRFLNWTAFVFTFGIGSAWGALRYEPEHRFSSGAFLALFFVLFLVDGTLFALRQPAARRGIIDTTLTFGNPLATLALAAGLFNDEPLYLALACALMAAVYLGTAGALLARRDEALRAMSQAYLAIGIGVATLAVPFALENALATALAWAAEASGLVWVGAKQARLRTRIAGYVLFVGALLALLARIADASPYGGPLYCALLAAAFAFATRTLDHFREHLRAVERYVAAGLFAVGLLLWLAAIPMAVRTPIVPFRFIDLATLALIAGSVLAFEIAGTALPFDRLRGVARGAFPYLLLFAPFAITGPLHPFANYAFVGWALALLIAFWALAQPYPALELRPRLRDALHASGAWLLALLLFSEAHFAGRGELGLAEGWSDGFELAAPLAVVATILYASRGPIARHRRAYLRGTALPLVLALSMLALFHQAASAASAAPLPYFPIVNPLDLAHLTVLLAAFALVRGGELSTATTLTLARWLGAGSLFALANATVVRTAHYWADVPYAPFHIPDDPLVQATFSILWTVIALVAMVFAHRKAARSVWIAGATLLGAVVLKLFVLDLASLSSVAKIVTFLAVGVLLLAVGYFAPVPPMETREEHKEKAQ